MKTTFIKSVPFALLIYGFSMQSAYAEGGYFESDPENFCPAVSDFFHCKKGDLLLIRERHEIGLSIASFCDLSEPIIKLPSEAGILCIARGSYRDKIQPRD